jgi:hypothetical protein
LSSVVEEATVFSDINDDCIAPEDSPYNLYGLTNQPPLKFQVKPDVSAKDKSGASIMEDNFTIEGLADMKHDTVQDNDHTPILQVEDIARESELPVIQSQKIKATPIKNDPDVDSTSSIAKSDLSTKKTVPECMTDTSKIPCLPDNKNLYYLVARIA